MRSSTNSRTREAVCLPEKATPFRFTEHSIVQALLGADGQRRIKHVGSACSHFQTEPLLYGQKGEPVVTSDWEFEVMRRLRGEHSGIPSADVHDLPRFLQRKEQYLDRSAALGEDTFRFSFDFGRLCPAEGEFNDRLMTEYIETLLLMKARGLEPFLALHHFTMPKWLVRTNQHGDVVSGAWEHPEVIGHFRFYVKNVIRCLTDERRVCAILKSLDITREMSEAIMINGIVRYFMTINEPASMLFGGYVAGSWPPYKRRSFLTLTRVLTRLVEAHDIAQAEIKLGIGTSLWRPQVCVGHIWQYFDGIGGRLANEIQGYCTDRFERDGTHSDFIALQHYFRRTLPLTSVASRSRDYSDHPAFGDVYPEGIFKVIRLLHKAYPRKNIFISEFGFADRADSRRPFWIVETIRYIIEAMRTGIPITGILLWTLVDNFEWELGMSQKFGLFSERQLTTELVPREDHISSWEVWRAAVTAIAAPSAEALGFLQRSYDRAYAQYKARGKR